MLLDVLDGKVCAEAARREKGRVVNLATGTVNEAATQSERAKLSEASS